MHDPGHSNPNKLRKFSIFVSEKTKDKRNWQNGVDKKKKYPFQKRCISIFQKGFVKQAHGQMDSSMDRWTAPWIDLPQAAPPPMNPTDAVSQDNIFCGRSLLIL